METALLTAGAALLGVLLTSALGIAEKLFSLSKESKLARQDRKRIAYAKLWAELHHLTFLSRLPTKLRLSKVEEFGSRDLTDAALAALLIPDHIREIVKSLTYTLKHVSSKESDNPSKEFKEDFDKVDSLLDTIIVALRKDLDEF